MKYKVIAVVLALTVMSWAQTATQTTPSTPQQSTVADKAKCACCDKMSAAAEKADTKDAQACCMRDGMKAKDGKDMASCCAGKDAKSADGKDAMSCMKGDKDKMSASCCKENCSKDGASCAKDKTAAACCGGSCGKDGKTAWCSSGKKADKTAKSCCTKELHS